MAVKRERTENTIINVKKITKTYIVFVIIHCYNSQFLHGIIVSAVLDLPLFPWCWDEKILQSRHDDHSDILKVSSVPCHLSAWWHAQQTANHWRDSMLLPRAQSDRSTGHLLWWFGIIREKHLCFLWLELPSCLRCFSGKNWRTAALQDIYLFLHGVSYNQGKKKM